MTPVSAAVTDTHEPVWIRRRGKESVALISAEDLSSLLKVPRLVSAVLRDPFDGLGKPEPLRHSLAGMWSRRIDKENRLVYQVEDERVRCVAARYHY